MAETNSPLAGSHLKCKEIILLHIYKRARVIILKYNLMN